MATIENLNKENIRTLLPFKNPLFNNQIIQKEEHIQNDSDDEKQSDNKYR